MKNQLTAKQISTEIANRLGLKFEAKDFSELRSFIEDIVPAIDAEWKHHTISFDDFFAYYEDESPMCFMSSEMSKDDAILFTDTYEKDFGKMDFVYYDSEYDNEWDNPKDSNENELVVEMNGGYFNDYLDTLKKISIITGRKYSAHIMNYYPLMLNGDNSEIQWEVFNGQIIGGGVLEIPKNDEELLILRSYWLKEVASSEEVLAKYGIELIWNEEENDKSKMKLSTSNLATCLSIKYSKNEVSVKDALKIIKEFPRAIDFIPKILLKNRVVILEFIKSNSKKIKEYYSLLRNNDSDDNVSSRVIRNDNAKQLEGMVQGIDDSIFSPFAKDKEVLNALGNSQLCINFSFNDDNYDEDAVASVINTAPALVQPLINYWIDKMPEEKKVEEHIRRKFNLDEKASLEVVSFCKCLEMIQSNKGEHIEAYSSLFSQWANISDYFKCSEVDNKSIAEIFNSFNRNIQNELSKGYYFLLRYMKPSNIDSELADCVAKTCPIADKLLSDEDILKHHMKVTSEDAQTKCEECLLCFRKHVIIG